MKCLTSDKCACVFRARLIWWFFQVVGSSKDVARGEDGKVLAEDQPSTSNTEYGRTPTGDAKLLTVLALLPMLTRQRGGW